jgi:hypothetical protein
MGRASDRHATNPHAKMPASSNFKLGLILLIFVLCFLSACSTEKKPVVEAQPSATATPTPANPGQPGQLAAKLPPPELPAVEQAVKRVFKDAVLIDNTRQPMFIAGDFNGDGSQDIAVVLKPAPDKLAEMNEEFPNWILRDPFGSLESQGPQLRVAANDEMLAVIHGYGTNGWRDPQATQTFLLKNVAGSGLETQSVKEFAAANQGKKVPALRGDLVGEMIQGKRGYLYFAGATYRWYDPKTFEGDEPEPGMFHGAPKKIVKK